VPLRMLCGGGAWGRAAPTLLSRAVDEDTGIC
jgi:hypothetical protein